MPTLTNARHELFAQALAGGRTAREAYVLAGYKESRHHASRLATNGNVRRRVDELVGAAAAQAEVTVARIVEELARIGFANMVDYMAIQPDGIATVDLSRLTRDQAAAIGELVVDYDDQVAGEEGAGRAVKRVRFKLLDKRAALVDLGRHLGMFRDRVEVAGPGGGDLVVQHVISADPLTDDEWEAEYGAPG